MNPLEEHTISPGLQRVIDETREKIRACFTKRMKIRVTIREDKQMAETCKTCRFWNVPSEVALTYVLTNTRADCRRYPPSAKGKITRTLDIDWCGEHQPREDKQ